MLMGEFQNSIDSKNRMIVPAKLRDGLGQKCVLTRGLDRCLWIYPMEQWKKQEEKLSSLPMSDPKARAFVRYITGNASECDIDKQGRLGLPSKLKDLAGIEKELVTVGVINYVEIWAKEVYEDSSNSAMMDEEAFLEFSSFYQI